jgi:hypothetical protein
MAIHLWIPRLVTKVNNATREYRITKGRLEVRDLNSDGTPYNGYKEWVLVTPEEIKYHFKIQSPIAQWLSRSLQSLQGRKVLRTESAAGEPTP